MNGTNLLLALTSFPKDTINGETVELMAPYFEQEDYNLETASHACGNVAGLCSWTKSMAIFYGINREVLPLKVSGVLQLLQLSKENSSKCKRSTSESMSIKALNKQSVLAFHFSIHMKCK